MKGTGVIVCVVAFAAQAAFAQDNAGVVDSGAQAAPAARVEKPMGGWWDDVFAERSVALAKILAAPESWRDLPVSFTIQFRQPLKNAAAFFTRFEPDQWLNFAAWPDEAPLWEKKAYDTDFQHLFIRRTSPDFKAIGTAATYDRFVVSGVVREVLKGKPWIEVVSVRKLQEKITEGSLVHLVKGLMLRDHRRYDSAAREFEAADGEGLPLSVRLLAMREQAFALLNARKPKSAEDRLVLAAALDPENAETALALAEVREAMKGMPPERPPVTLPQVPAAEPAPEDEEPITPGPPDPLADRPRKPKAAAPAKPPETNPGRTVPRRPVPRSSGN
jgi:hypothetical protein